MGRDAEVVHQEPYVVADVPHTGGCVRPKASPLNRLRAGQRVRCARPLSGGRVQLWLRDGAGTLQSMVGQVGERLLTTFKRHNDLLEGACGGNMDCGTCHVLVDDAWAPRLPTASGLLREPGEPAGAGCRRPFC